MAVAPVSAGTGRGSLFFMWDVLGSAVDPAVVPAAEESVCDEGLVGLGCWRSRGIVSGLGLSRAIA